MNIFCENCGRNIRAGNYFCEECGTPIILESSAHCDPFKNGESFCWAMFSSSAPDTERQHAIELCKKATACGLIVTDLRRMRQVLGGDYQSFADALSGYVDQCRLHGICYQILDTANCNVGTVSDGDWNTYVGLIRNAVRAHADFTARSVQGIFILGGHSVIPMAVYENKADDPDCDVDSDLPYATLHTGNPWQGDPRSFSAGLCVGRLPIDEGIPLSFWLNYLSNAVTARSAFLKGAGALGLSAKQWIQTSNHVFGNLFQATVDTSPPVNLKTIRSDYVSDSSFQYFNLHGASTEPYWYGQEGSAYPEAFAPEIAKTAQNLNIVGVEACYGARFIDLHPQQSIVLTSLGNKTVSFLGSSRIAFGPASPPIGLADVIVQQFIEGMKSGMCAGEALNAGRKMVLNVPDLDPAGLKTVLEFNLFGDPLLSVVPSSKALFRIPHGFTSETDFIVVLPGVLNVVQTEVDRIRQTIRKQIDAHVYQRYPVLSGTEPTTSKIMVGSSRRELTRLAYHIMHGPIGTTVLIYADEEGNIKKELVSK